MTKSKIRLGLRGAVRLVLLWLASVGAAQAANPFPTRPIRILVNTGPGGLLDVTTRVVAVKMSELLGL